MLKRSTILSTFCLAASLLTFAGCDTLMPTGGPKTNPMYIPDEPVAETEAPQVDVQPVVNEATEETASESTAL